jgi:hypothetical protein
VADEEAPRPDARRPRQAVPAPLPQRARTGKELRKGQVYWVVNTDDLDRPRRGRVVRLTNSPGKRVGVEFDGPVGPHVLHDCDGAGALGKCLYCRPDQVLTEAEYRGHAERRRGIAEAPREVLEDLDVIRLDDEGDGGPAPG